MKRRRATLALVCALAVAAGGCASVSDTAQNRSLDALKTPDPEPLAGLRERTGTPACERDPYRSLAPGALPRPGHMPPGTLMAQIQRSGSLRVGVDQNSLGLGYFDPVTQRMRGFDVEVARSVARAIFGGRGDIDDHIRFTALSTAAARRGDPLRQRRHRRERVHDHLRSQAADDLQLGLPPRAHAAAGSGGLQHQAL